MRDFKSRRQFLINSANFGTWTSPKINLKQNQLNVQVFHLKGVVADPEVTKPVVVLEFKTYSSEGNGSRSVATKPVDPPTVGPACCLTRQIQQKGM